MHTDGACVPNPGPGAWAFTLRFGDAYEELSGCSSGVTTNNRMELQAVVEGLKAIRHPSRVVIRTDSKNTIAWCRPGAFKGVARQQKFPQAYALVREFNRLASIHAVTFEWVRGHNGDQDNERCDALCARALENALHSAQTSSENPPSTRAVASGEIRRPTMRNGFISRFSIPNDLSIPDPV